MNLEFRRIAGTRFIGTPYALDALAVALDQPQPDRVDEEAHLRVYLRQRIAEAEARAAQVAALRERTPFVDRDSLMDALNRATEQAEANGGWGNAANEAADAFTAKETGMDARYADFDRQTTAAPEDVAPFQVGDVVRLVSGGPRLSVIDVFRCESCERWHVDVCWHDYQGIFNEVEGLDADLFEMVTERD